MMLVLSLLLVALVFEYINGFLDSANAIATVVATRALTPGQALAMSALFNLVGALLGTAVATTIGSKLVDTEFVSLHTILGALMGAVVWNLVVWRWGLPSSSSHALVGGLCGATLASAHGQLGVIHWFCQNPVTHAPEGLWPKVILPMIVSPIVGISVGFIFMGMLLGLLRNWRPVEVNRIFGKAQLLSASWMSLSHGTNDAQKTMGIIALILFAATRSGCFKQLPPWLSFLHTPQFTVPFWVKLICALTMAAGTAFGGWRVIRTVGTKITRLRPIHGFAAQTTAAAVIQLASHWGIPLSTTHICSTSIMGVGATKRISAVKWGMVGDIACAWVLTIPATFLLGFVFMSTFQKLGLVQ